MRQTDALVFLKQISETFASIKALPDVGFDIDKSCVQTLMGEKNSGKSMFIKTLSGAYALDRKAEIVIGGKAVDKLNHLEAARNGMIVSYQDFCFFPNLSVAVKLYQSWHKTSTLLILIFILLFFVGIIHNIFNGSLLFSPKFTMNEIFCHIYG